MLELLANRFKHKRWYLDQLSGNPGMTWDLYKNWPADAILRNDWSTYKLAQVLDIDDILAHPRSGWTLHDVVQNPSVSLDFINAHPTMLQDKQQMSYNPNLTTKFIFEHDDLKERAEAGIYRSKHDFSDMWNWEGILTGPLIPWSFIESSLGNDVLSGRKTIKDGALAPYARDWTPWAISHNPNVTWDNIMTTDNGLWNTYAVSCHPCVTYNIMRSHTTLFAWDSSAYSHNPSINFDIIFNNPKDIWDTSTVSWNPNLTPLVIEKHPRYPWNWMWISDNKLDMDIALRRRNAQTLGCELRKHTTLPLELIDLVEMWC